MSAQQTILVTGASNGIGAALARHYAGPGTTLALSGRSTERLEAVAQACREQGAICQTQTLDVRDAAALVAWINSVHAQTPIDLAILNAGIAGTRTSPAAGERIDEMQAQIDTNLGGTLLAAQTLGALMHARRSGHLVLISSLNGLFPVVEAPTYSATKAGILSYAEAIRDWLEPAGVRVTAVCPGFVRTGIAERYSGPRPLEISAAQAAAKIAGGVGRHRRRISFPWPLVAAIALGKFVPRPIRRRVLGAYSAQLAPISPEEMLRPDERKERDRL